MSGERIRAFIAVNLPVTVIRRVADDVKALQSPVAQAGFKVAWVPAANIHLTLKFLGHIPAESAEAVHGKLRQGLAGRAPFELEVRGLGAFPSASHPRVLWAGVRPHERLAALQQEVEAWCEALGHAREERAFHPHLTVGRVKSQAQGATLETLLSARADTVYGSGRIGEVVLYESRTLREGAEYTALARVPLGA
jgi:2'-5' RNA ligase